MISIEQGSIDIWIDEIVPCLKDTQTGEIKETVVFKIESRAYLKKFRKSNGWHINWNEVPKNVDVYALALKDDNTIQGIVGIKNLLRENSYFLKQLGIFVYFAYTCT